MLNNNFSINFTKIIKNMNLIIFILIFLSCSAQKNEPDWSLVWSDEFNYIGLPDTTKWGNEVGFIRMSFSTTQNSVLIIQKLRMAIY